MKEEEETWRMLDIFFSKARPVRNTSCKKLKGGRSLCKEVVLSDPTSSTGEVPSSVKYGTKGQSFNSARYQTCRKCGPYQRPNVKFNLTRFPSSVGR